MARAGSLILEIGADIAKLRENMEQTKAIFDKNMGDMRSIAKGAAGAIAGYFTVDMIKDSIKSTLDLADSMSKASQKVGFTVDTLYALNAAAQLSDVEFTNLESALGKFNKNLGEISMGAGDEAANALKNMGISTKDAAGQLKASDALLMEVSDKFQSMPDGVNKTTLAMKLFGKSGAELIPLLNGGSESLKEFSGGMNKETAQAAERLNDSFTRLKLSTEAGLIRTLTAALPVVNDISQGIENFAAKGSILSKNQYEIGEAIAITWNTSKTTFDATYNSLESLIGAFSDISTEIFIFTGEMLGADTTAQKGLNTFQNAVVIVNSLALGFTAISNTVRAGVNDFMNLGFAAEKASLKIKDFAGQASAQDKQRIIELDKFIANRDLQNANMALTESTLAKSIMDYKNSASFGNQLKDDGILKEFDTAKRAKDAMQGFLRLEEVRKEALSKYGSDAQKAAVIEKYFQSSLSALNDNFQPKKAGAGLTDYAVKAAEAKKAAEALARATEKAFGELNKNYLDGTMGQFYDLKLKYADELTALKGNEEAKAALKLSYIEKVEGLKLDYAIKQAEEEQQIAENYKQSKLRMLSTDERYYKAIGDISSQWAVKEQQLQIELSNESIERRAAIIAFEKESFKESIAMNTANLKHMQTAAEGAEFWSKKSIASLQNEAEKMNSLLDGIAGSMENTFMSIPDAVQKGTLETGKLLQSFADDVVKELWRIYVVKQLVAGATSAISNMFAPNAPAMDSSGQIGGTDTSSLLSAGYTAKAKGGAYDGGIEFYANGGAFTNQIVSKPTMFKYGAGLGVMGEAGPEAIMPLTRASDGSLGVRSTGGSSQNLSIVVEIKNESGTALKATKQDAQFDGKQYIVSVVTEAIETNSGNIRTSIKGAVNG